MRFSSRSFAAAVLAASIAGCTENKTIDAPIPPGKSVGRLLISATFSTAATTIAGRLGDFGIGFDRARVTVRSAGDAGSVVLDTIVGVGPAIRSLSLDLRVPVSKIGDSLNALVQFVGSTGTVYSGTVELQSYAADSPAPEPTPLALDFVGPGSRLKTLTISPKPAKLVASQTIPLTVVATDSTGASSDDTPLVFTSSDESVAKVIAVGSAHSIQAFAKRGQAIIIATTPLGISDTVSAIVTLPPASIAVVSGGGQTGVVGTLLAQPVVVQVSASDGVGVPDVTVGFAAPSGGSVGAATAVTDANGRASTTMTLSTIAGAQSFALSAGALPATSVVATALPGPASIATSTLSTSATQINPDDHTPAVISVRTTDQFGNVIGKGGASVTLTTTLGHWGAGSSTTTAAADNGDGTYSATLYSAQPGTAAITGTIGGAAIATPSVNVTAIVPVVDHFDVTLANGAPITDRQVGVASAVRIRALDASGNVVTGYSGQAILSVSSGTLIGGNPNITTPAAIAGVINMSVTFGRAALNVSLSVAGGTKTGSSASFNVFALPAVMTARNSTLILSLGQTPTSAQYPTISITDADGNSAGPQAVAFTVSGPCTFQGSAKTAQFTSDTQGSIAFNASTLIIPTTSTTLPFSCLLSGTAGSFTAPSVYVALLVPSTSMTVFTGHTDDAWETSDNWTAGLPSATKSAFIAASQARASLLAPVIRSSSPSISSVDVEDGASLDLNGHTLTVAQNIDARLTGVVAGGTITVPAGSPGGIMRGTLPTVNCQGGAYALSGTTHIVGSLTASDCVVDVGHDSLFVSGALSTASTGALRMADALSTVDIAGSATFGGANHLGILSAGVLAIHGDFNQTGNGTFGPNGSMLLRLLPPATGPQNQTVTFADLANSFLETVEVGLAPGRTVTIASPVKIIAGLTISKVGGTGTTTLSLPVGLSSVINGYIVIRGGGVDVVVDAGAVIPTSLMIFGSGSSATLTGGGGFTAPHGEYDFRANAHLTINSQTFGLPPAGACVREAGVVIDGTNTAAVSALNNPANCPH